jgi:subtilisin family serine protease
MGVEIVQGGVAMWIPRGIVITFVVVFLFIAQVAAGTCQAKSPADGAFEMSQRNSLLSLDANNARLDAILAQIARATQIEIKTSSDMHSRVTLSSRNVRLDSLMRRIGLNFMFLEGPGENGRPVRRLFVFAKTSSEMASPQNMVITATRESASSGETARDRASSGVAQRQGESTRSNKYRAGEHRPDELLVRFRPELEPEQIEALNSLHSARVIKTIPYVNIYQLKFPEGSDLPAIEKSYQESSLIEKIEPNTLLRLPEVRPNDAEFAEQWGLQKMMVPEAWNITTGSSSVVVAILDTGIDADHPDLTNRITAGYEAGHGKAGIPDDDHGHGTQMAGIIAGEGQNATGISGVNWSCTILPVKVLDADGMGTAADIAEGLIYAAEHGAQVINMSFGGHGYSEMLNETIQVVHRRNAVLIAGAGNENTDRPSYPAAYPNVLAVTATGPEDEKWTDASFGSDVDLAAPGVGILTTTINGGYGYGTGTSHAAAMVSGVAALLKAKDAGYSNIQIENLLQATADDLGKAGRDPSFGAGRVNALRALTSGVTADGSLPVMAK